MVGGYMIVLRREPCRLRFASSSCSRSVVALALAMERVAFRPLAGRRPDTLLVTSFAVSYLLQSLAILTKAPSRGAPGTSAPQRVVLDPGLSDPEARRLTVAVTVVLLVALVLFLGRTRLGVQMRAAAEDFQMARISVFAPTRSSPPRSPSAVSCRSGAPSSSCPDRAGLAVDRARSRPGAFIANDHRRTRHAPRSRPRRLYARRHHRSPPGNAATRVRPYRDAFVFTAVDLS